VRFNPTPDNGGPDSGKPVPDSISPRRADGTYGAHDLQRELEGRLSPDRTEAPPSEEVGSSMVCLSAAPVIGNGPTIPK
jgi:hypothetical protein